MTQRFLPALVAVLVMSAVAGVTATAFAVSDGNYTPANQNCNGDANNSDRPWWVQEGCQNFTVALQDSRHHEGARVGLRQVKDGESPDPRPQLSITPARADMGEPRVYLGADDNLDNGEHDSSDQINNGPSDGGAIQLNYSPASLQRWSSALAGGDLAFLLTHPTPLVDAGTGACADGICLSVQTQRRVAFQGGTKGKHRDVSNYEGKQWDPTTCAGPDERPKNCGGKPLKAWNDREGTTYVQPGVQVFEDPDAQGSPVGPYPLPAAYAGTCGVILGGGAAPHAPAGPLTNKAGQVVLKTGCG